MKKKKGNKLQFTNDSPVDASEITFYEQWSEYIYAQDGFFILQTVYTMIKDVKFSKEQQGNA